MLAFAIITVRHGLTVTSLHYMQRKLALEGEGAGFKHIGKMLARV